MTQPDRDYSSGMRITEITSSAASQRKTPAICQIRTLRSRTSSFQAESLSLDDAWARDATSSSRLASDSETHDHHDHDHHDSDHDHDTATESALYFLSQTATAQFAETGSAVLHRNDPKSAT
eukprot:1939123-Rhodomonas_salina.1